VVKRKALADSIRANRKNKKDLSRIGRLMIKRQGDLAKGGYRDAWTPMRFVSREEIEEMRRRVLNLLSPIDVVGWDAMGQPVEITRRTGERSATDVYITKPGFYRADPMPEDNGRPDTSCLSVVCAGGIAYYRFEESRANVQECWRKEREGLDKYRKKGREAEALRKMWREKQVDPRFVYLISVEMGGTCYHKIGISKDPEGRCRSIATNLPEKPTVTRHFWSSNARAEEYELHCSFCEHNSHGEWFIFDDEQLERVLNEYDKRERANQQREAAA